MIKRLAGTCVLVLGVLAFAGSAFAGNGNGNGNGAKPGPSDAAPGNSASAPGQAKKDVPSAAEQTTTTTAGQPAVPSEGVKPSSDTAKDTHAAAASNETKQYGNGQTAGEIAIKNGAAGNTALHGPGNSQPHKASPCSGGHEVDVHALKSRRAGSCGSTGPQTHPTPVPSPPGTTTTTTSEQRPPARPVSDPASQPTTTGGSAGGVVATSSRSDGDSQGALASERLGRSASLPFTGSRLWMTALFGLFLIAAGLGLQQIRTAEAAVESGHEHTNRARHAARGARPPVPGRTGR